MTSRAARSNHVCLSRQNEHVRVAVSGATEPETNYVVKPRDLIVDVGLLLMPTMPPGSMKAGRDWYLSQTQSATVAPLWAWERRSLVRARFCLLKAGSLLLGLAYHMGALIPKHEINQISVTRALSLPFLTLTTAGLPLIAL